MLEIDGSYGEGGGQILRTSLTLSAVTKKPFHISQIRARRLNPGLQPQHLTACTSLRKICRGELQGAELESQELTFIPGEIIGGDYRFDIGTAGSVVLVAQTLLPILLYASKKSSLQIFGGTHVLKSPGYDYFEKIFLPAIRRFGMPVEAKLVYPGYYPKGGGLIEVKTRPASLKGNENWANEDISHALIRLSNLPRDIAEREKNILREHAISDVRIEEEPALSPGNAVTLWKGFRGAYVLGERGKRAEIVAEEAFSLLNQENEEIDSHLADQLLLYAALAEGKSSFTTSHITEHLRTNAYVIERFLERKVYISSSQISFL